MADNVGIDFNSLVTEVDDVVNAVNTVLQFAEKYDSILPASLQSAVEEISGVVGFVQKLLNQVPSI
jgi:hypothetical protein